MKTSEFDFLRSLNQSHTHTHTHTHTNTHSIVWGCWKLWMEANLKIVTRKYKLKWQKTFRTFCEWGNSIIIIHTII